MARFRSKVEMDLTNVLSEQSEGFEQFGPSLTQSLHPHPSTPTPPPSLYSLTMS